MRRFWILALSWIVMFLNFIMGITALVEKTGDDNVWVVGWMLLSATAITCVLVDTIVPDFWSIKSKKSTTERRFTLSKDGNSRIYTESELIGKEIQVFDYELYENIGDLDDNEYYWKPAKILRLEKEADGTWSMVVETEDGKKIDNLGTEYLRGL